MSERARAPSGEEINIQFTLALRKLGVDTSEDLDLKALRDALEQNLELDEDDPDKLSVEEANAVSDQLATGGQNPDQPLGEKTDNPDTLEKLRAMERGFLQQAASAAFVEVAGTGERRAIAVKRVHGGASPMDVPRIPLAVEDFEPPNLPAPAIIDMLRARGRRQR